MPEQHVSAEQLAQWEQLAGEATPGPWVIDRRANWMVVCADGNWGGFVVCDTLYSASDSDLAADAAFIAAARTAVPALCAKVRRLQQELDVCRAAQRGGSGTPRQD